MERKTSLKKAREIMGKNFIGLDELISIQEKMGIYIPEELKNNCPSINFTEDTLEKNKDDYILILGIPYYKDRTPLTIVKMREHFGWDPDKSEPCFYNQDWYLNEKFANSNIMKENWHLLRKEVYGEHRGMAVDSIKRSKTLKFPEAIVCTYIFFCYNLISGQFLWRNDFTWCSDTDNNNDYIYVGRYDKPHKQNKNGFEVHRHLSINHNLSIINLITENNFNNL